MRKVLSWIRQDFRRVYWTIKYESNYKTPTWVIVLWYILLFPIGALLWVVYMIYSAYRGYRLEKQILEILGEDEES